jgi:hypothetical protein
LSEEDNVTSISFKCSIKQEKGKASAAKWLTIPNTHEAFKKKIQQVVQEDLGFKVDREDYRLEYKAANKNGIGTLLTEAEDFGRFLSEHTRLAKAKKDMLVMIVVKEMKNKRQKRKVSRDSDVSITTMLCESAYLQTFDFVHRPQVV